MEGWELTVPSSNEDDLQDWGLLRWQRGLAPPLVRGSLHLYPSGNRVWIGIGVRMTLRFQGLPIRKALAFTKDEMAECQLQPPPA